MPTIRFKESVHPQQVDFPEQCERSCKGSMHICPGNVRNVTSEEAYYLSKLGLAFDVFEILIVSGGSSNMENQQEDMDWTPVQLADAEDHTLEYMQDPCSDHMTFSSTQKFNDFEEKEVQGKKRNKKYKK